MAPGADAGGDHPAVRVARRRPPDLLLLGRPLAALTSGLTNWLNGMSGTGHLLGVILGLMMCFDLGGPVNKAAYAFAVAGLTVPPTRRRTYHGRCHGRRHGAAAGDGTRIHCSPGLFPPERENGRAAWLLGAASSARVRFRSPRPTRSASSRLDGVGARSPADCHGARRQSLAPHGGIFVFFAIGPILWFIVALRVGTVAGALAVIAAKQFVNPRPWKKPTRLSRRLACTPSARDQVHTINRSRHEENPMPAKTVIVGSAIGLHARPAAIIAEAVVNAGVPVRFRWTAASPSTPAPP